MKPPSSQLTLRYYQADAITAFFDYCGNNHGKHPVIVLPTGTGKSLVQAHIVKEMLKYEDTRILLLTHRKELIKQNYDELIENFGGDMFLDAGIYSAGLNCRDTRNRILFAGIQSVYTKAWELGFFDLILIDESHLINHEGEGMYRTFLAEMEKINSKIVMGGLTATPYRMKHGLITEGKGAIFDDVCYEVTIKELIDPNHFRNKDHKQYLCNLISKNGVNKVDLSNVHIRAGEYKSDEMEKAFKENDLVCKAVKEIQEFTSDRKKILVFTAGISHCEEVTEKMNALGMTARCIHSKQSESINDKNISDFKLGQYRYLCNADKLTTGFNEKAIDCIILLRSTMSPGLYSQMVGRGFRLHPDKQDCLILDFGRNVEKHGPVDKIEIRKKKDGSGNEINVAPHKECPNCRSLIALSVMICPDCGYEFPETAKHEDTASEADVLSKWKKPETMDVHEVSYSRHTKEGKTDSLRVDYQIHMNEKYSEWVCVEHEGFAKQKAEAWIKSRFDKKIDSIEEALKNKDLFRKTLQVIVNFNDKFPKIVGYILESKEEYNARMKEELERQKQEEQDFLKDVW